MKRLALNLLEYKAMGQRDPIELVSVQGSRLNRNSDKISHGDNKVKRVSSWASDFGAGHCAP